MVRSHLRFRVLLTAALVAAVAPLIAVRACGPFFEAEVFTRGDHPDNPQVFAAGHLGVLQPNYSRADKVVAFRYLSGGSLSRKEQEAYAPPPQPPTIVQGTWEEQERQRDQETPAGRWLSARAQFTTNAPNPRPTSDRVVETQRENYVQRDEVLNCTDGSFEMAIATLHSRAKAWGAQSADLKDWIAGQDSVFTNCAGDGKIPEPARAGASQLLQQDRAYQIAAAHFYAMQFDEAIPGFEAISKDTSSPWSRWGEYLAARGEIRKAFFSTATVEWGEQARFDPALMQSAKARLVRVAETDDPGMKHAALAELSFINVRLEPEKHLLEAATALAGPEPDPDFTQHLDDLRFLTDRSVIANAELLNWMGLGEKINSPAEEWKTTKRLPWLVAAIAAAKPDDADAPALMTAAAALTPTSPAYITANYHRIRMMLQAGQRQQARELATTLLSSLHGEGMASSRNAVLAQRMPTASTLTEFLADAPRTVIPSEFPSEAASNLPCVKQPSGECVQKIPPAQFDRDAASAFNTQLPLSLWIKAAAPASPMPQHLREAVAWAGWVRALGLHDDTTAKHLAPMLPARVRDTAGDSTGFPATLAMLRNPGLTPRIQQGVQRSASFHQLGDYRGNWWCDLGTGEGQQWNENDPPLPLPDLPLSFLTQEQRTKAANEQAALKEMSDRIAWLGRRAIDYVKAHPDDPHAAESLHLTVRATRYGCYVPQGKEAARKTVSKEAFQLLHRRYPKSPWTDKTPYYY